MLRLALLSLLALPACTDPTLGLGVTLGTGGVAVSPSLSGQMGGVTVAVSP
jgi:hypothetical protein